MTLQLVFHLAALSSGQAHTMLVTVLMETVLTMTMSMLTVWMLTVLMLTVLMVTVLMVRCKALPVKGQMMFCTVACKVQVGHQS